MSSSGPRRLCITDVGSTTTKAILFRETAGGSWEYFRSEAPTTVERPEEDVSVGVLNSLRALERETGEELLRDGAPAVPYLSTSSAGGGLAMVVTGLVRELTAETADRVALGAGAIVLDVVCMNDGRTAYRQIEDLKLLRPDMVLLAGGYEGEAISAPVFLAELLVESELRPKLNPDARLPVVYAGNSNARPYVEQALGDSFMFTPVPNVRPTENLERTRPARAAIHKVFMDHVMSMAPGYAKLKPWVAAPIRPTPAAFSDLLSLVSRETDSSILAVDIGGATTDVFSARGGEVVRTVSANIGMSYSALNVAGLAGTGPISELLDTEMSAREIWNRIGNKHTHPTSLPATRDDSMVEWAVATVAVREAVREHLRVMRSIPERERPGPFDVNAMLREEPGRRGETRRLKILDYDLVIGSGGVLSHSPRDVARMILMNALSPDGATELAVDRAFMFPHLGVMADVDADLAKRLFFDMALVKLGTAGEAGEPARASSVVGAAYEPPGAAAPAANGPRVTSGRLLVRRELAIEGDVLVSEGDAVESSTVVARAVRQFLRPFFLNVARVMQVAPEEVGRILLKKPGDEVKLDEVIARQKLRLGVPSSYRSPVEGAVEKILPDGTVVVRENPERARVLTTVQVAEDLGVYPERLKPYLRVSQGDEVERGQWLGAVISSGSRRTSESPVRGRVARIDEHFGMVMIEPILDELQVEAWLPGTVESVDDRGCTIAADGVEIVGNWGSGGETSGPIRSGAPEPGCIHLVDHLDARGVSRSREADVSAVVARSADLIDVLEPGLGFTLVVLGRFGAESNGEAEEAFHLLSAEDGHPALADGTTQLRVGVRRPRIILPS